MRFCFRISLVEKSLLVELFLDERLSVDTFFETRWAEDFRLRRIVEGAIFGYQSTEYLSFLVNDPTFPFSQHKKASLRE